LGLKHYRKLYGTKNMIMVQDSKVNS
jgi:hypothetical protein